MSNKKVVALFSATATRDSLLAALAAVARVVPGRATLPVLSNLRIEATEQGLRFAGTDLDVAVVTEIAADVQGRGATTVHAKKLQEIVKKLPPSPARLAAYPDGTVTLESGRASFRLLTLPAEEFPSLPSVKWDAGTVPSGELRTAITQTAFAVSKEASRPILNGVLWELSPERLRLVATNGHRLALVDRPLSPTIGLSREVIIPAAAMRHVAKLFASDGDVEIGLADNFIGFRVGATTLLTRLIEGPYPNYRQVIPGNHTVQVTVDRVALLLATERMATVASKQTHRLRISIGKNAIALSADTPDVGEASETVTARTEGPLLTMGISAEHLSELLIAATTDEVVLRATTAERALTLDSPGDDGVRFLVMPLRLLDDGRAAA